MFILFMCYDRKILGGANENMNNDPDPWHKPDIPRPWDEDDEEEED